MLTEKNLTAVTVAFLLVYLSIACSCATGRYLQTESAKTVEITGTYNLILYGGNHINDKKTLAILIKEDEPYKFEVFAPDFDYRIVKGVPALKALEKAKKFVSFHHAFWKTQLRKILDKQGNTIGYEMRPLYYPEVYGESNILDVYYKQTGSKVIVFIRLISPQLESMPFEGAGKGIDVK